MVQAASRASSTSRCKQHQPLQDLHHETGDRRDTEKEIRVWSLMKDGCLGPRCPGKPRVRPDTGPGQEVGNVWQRQPVTH